MKVSADSPLLRACIVVASCLGDIACRSHGEVVVPDLDDPVRASEGDASILGTDADRNGVRDDVDAYIAALESEPPKRAALVSFARAGTSMMALGAAPGATQQAALARHTEVVRAIDCLATLYSLLERRTRVMQIQSALHNNANRLLAYHRADALLSGTILPAPGYGCPAIAEGTK